MKVAICPNCGKGVPLTKENNHTYHGLVSGTYYGECCGKFVFEKENR